MLAHSHDLWYNSFARPRDAEDFGQLFQILRCCFSNREDGVTEPAHTQSAEFLIKEGNPKLTGK